MANISKIKLPNGTTYTLKDNGALQLTGGTVSGPVSFNDSISIDDATIGNLVVNGSASFTNGIKATILPLQTKTYTGVIATANSDPEAFFYFGKILPTSYSQPWKVTYKLYCTIAGETDGYQVSYITITGCKNTYYTYRTHNTVPNTNRRPIYYHIFYSAKEAGITNSYGHLLGVGLRYSYNPATAANARTIRVEILETEDCNITFFDSMTLYSNVPGTGTTNYNARALLDATTQGFSETGDRNDVNYQNREQYGNRTTSAALYRYQVCLTKLDGTLVPINSVNNSIATNKTLTTDSFNPFGEIYWWNSTTTYSAGANVGDGGWYKQHHVVDLRYSFNCGGYDVTSTLTGRQPLYLVCTPQSDGSAKLYQSPLSQTLPSSDDGLLYIYLGRVYPDTYPYRLSLSYDHPIYWYKNGMVRKYSGDVATVTGHTVAVDVPSGAKFTDTVTTATTTGSGNAVTAITASNGALTVTKGTTFLTAHQSVSNKGATLSWGTAVTVATIGSTDIKVSLPSNPDTHHTAYIRAGASGGTANAATTTGNTYLNLVENGANRSGVKLVPGSNMTITSDASGNVTFKATDTTYSSQAAASGGTAVSLVTTGEKYTWNNKQAALVSGTNIKTINGSSILGSGNLAIAQGVTKISTTITIAASAWSNNTATITVSGITSSSDVIIMPTDDNAYDWFDHNIHCSAQNTNQLTFTCSFVPEQAMTVKILAFN